MQSALPQASSVRHESIVGRGAADVHTFGQPGQKMPDLDKGVNLLFTYDLSAACGGVVTYTDTSG